MCIQIYIYISMYLIECNMYHRYGFVSQKHKVDIGFKHMISIIYMYIALLLPVACTQRIYWLQRFMVNNVIRGRY